MSGEISAHQIWKKLKTTYTKDGAVNQILARKKLATMKKRRDCTMQQHIDEIFGVVNDLRLCGVDVKDMDLVVYILMSLPPEFDVIKAAIENQPSENLNIEFVTQRLVDAEALMLDKNALKGNFSSKSVPVTCDNTAFGASKRDIVCYICKGKGHYAKFCRRKATCYSCGRTGHFKRDCKIKQKVDTKTESAAVTFAVGELEKNCFLVDSGATSHMTSRRDWFGEFKSYSGTVACASKSDRLKIVGIGSVTGILQGREITLKNVLFVPDLNGELISVKNIQAAGYTVIFKDNKAMVKKGDECFIIAELNNKGQYVSEFSPVKAAAYVATFDANLWHRRMGHSSNKVLREMGLPTTDDFCKECTMAKQSNEPIGKGPRQRENVPMKMVHTDICGPIDPPTSAGEKYFVTIIDDCSRFSEVHLLKHKNDIVEILSFFFKQNPEVSKIRCDNAKEYVTGELVLCCRKAGILIDPAPPYTPPLNGVAERANRYLLEKARALIFEANLPKKFWGYAVQTAAYLKNRMPSQSIDNCIPYKLKHGRQPDLDNIKVFGCDAYMRISDSQRKKLDPKSRKMVFVGYSSMGYRLLDLNTKRVVISRNVKFDEEKKVCIIDILHNNADTDEVDDISAQIESNNDSNEDKTDTLTENDIKSRPKRNIKLPSYLNDYYVYEALTSLASISYEDFEKLPAEQQSSWRKAMDDEIDSMKRNGVWELVEYPKDQKPISCKWVLREKRDGVFKARLVARGFLQRHEIDYFETYAPVISISSLRLMLAIIFQKELKVFALDVKTAFLNGELQEIIFMEQPMGYNDNSGRVCKLLKSLYGLKQAPRQWFKRFIDFVLRLNFQQHSSEQCIFVKRTNNREIIMVLYVDDLLIAGSDESEVKVVIKLLRSEFEMSKTEVANEFLGICLDFSPDHLCLSQEAYIKRLLERFKMADCKPSDTPLTPKSTTSDFELGENFHGPYRELIGALLYLAPPDILYSVNCLSQMQEQPTDAAWSGLKKILRYLKGTSKLKLMFHKSNIDNPTISVYVDADWGADARDRKSISGYFIMFNNCPITWCVKKQTSIALSTTEAEILALGKAVQDIVLFYNVAKEILGCADINITIFEDNQSAIKAISSENH